MVWHLEGLNSWHFLIIFPALGGIESALSPEDYHS
jgi:hypothetical protein